MYYIGRDLLGFPVNKVKTIVLSVDMVGNAVGGRWRTEPYRAAPASR
jgi:hypothetical protein